MAHAPKIVLSPASLPQQRLVLVEELPPRPVGFTCMVGNYAEWPEGVMPKQGVPRSPTYLFQAEWASTPYNYGVNAYYVQARRRHWLLWNRYFDDNGWPWRWCWVLIGYCNRAKIDERTAATHLLLEYWADQCRDVGRYLAPYHWINEEALFSVADIEAVTRELKGRFTKTV